MKLTAIVDGQPLEIEINRSSTTIQAEIEGRKYSIDCVTVRPGVYWFSLNGRSQEITIVPQGDGYMVCLDGKHVPVEIVDPRSRLRKAARQGHDGVAELRAPMPGKIVKLLVSEGAEVEANQPLLVMEAMKMQNEVKSPKKGVLSRMAVQEAAAVNAGDLLAVVE